ncbi:Alpha/Beta hydrolase protein, partial [Powellomyces hirtus]
MHLQEEKVTVPSTDKVELETRLYRGAGRKQTCVILTHPYGPLGGNFENNVVQALFDNFASQGFMTVRFNFRGAGRSTGRTSFKGAGEADDVLSICRYVRGRPEIAPTHIILCGYSYGSVAAGAITRQVSELAGFISISYPSGVLWFLTFFGSNKLKAQLMEIPANIPKLFICGNRDNFTSEANFKKFVDELPNENKTVVVVNEATHFWNEMEQVLVAHVNQ